MKVLRKSIAFIVLICSLLATTGCHLLSHYTTEEVHDYLHKQYPSLSYTLTEHYFHTWTVTFDQYPHLPIQIEEKLHTSAPVVPQIDRILTTNIPTVTALPLLQNYLTNTEQSYAAYDDDYRYIKIDIPDSAIHNSDVSDFYNRINQFCKDYATQYPDFKKDVTIAVFIRPPKGVEVPDGYRKIFRSNQIEPR